MSDCFDHEMDAWESQAHDSLYGDGDGGRSYNRSRERDPLHYHNKYMDISIEATTEKAYLIKFNDGDKCWVAKKLCKKLEKDSVYIWHGVKLTPIKEPK